MTNKFIIILFISFSFNGVCQTELTANQEIPKLFSPNIKIDSTNNLNDFPDFIQTKSKDVLKWYTGEFYDSIYFIKGQNIDLKALNEKGFFKDSTSIFNYFETERTIPKYELYFGLTDISINIKRIIIKLTFDEYGQILEFHWPFYVNKKDDYRQSSQITTILNEITKDYSKNEADELKIKYDVNLKNFVWEFVYDLTDKEQKEKEFGVSSIEINVVSIPAFETEKK